MSEATRSIPLRIGLVVEGPTDEIVLRAAISNLLPGRELAFTLMQPDFPWHSMEQAKGGRAYTVGAGRRPAKVGVQFRDRSRCSITMPSSFSWTLTLPKRPTSAVTSMTRRQPIFPVCSRAHRQTPRRMHSES